MIKITLENILLAVSLVILFLSYSRIGWLAFLVYFGYLFLRLMDSFRQKLASRMLKSESATMTIGRFLFNAGFWFLFLIFMLAILIFVGWIFTKVDRRMQQFLDIQVILDLGLLGWASKLEFAERIVYWIAGFKVFLHHPVFGVGLGNSGFFIPQNLSSFGYGLPEVLRIFLSNTFLPNPKNLWVRILAETGIVGFSVFVSWLWVGWKTARSNERSLSPLAQAMGITGQVVIVGLIIEGFSLDTFALPYYWMTLGLVVAVYRIFSLNSGRSIQPNVPAEIQSNLHS
ncbi:O-antigen ligase domain-containing protein [bacterium]|nr:O-antigen ligase domain-containing protein [bacterium]